MGFGIQADKTEKEVDYEIDEQNFLADFVSFSRDQQVLNEEQSAVVMMAVATGLMEDHEYYTSTIVTGGSSGGKSHLLNEVIFEAFSYADDVHDWVYELTGGSDKAAIDDEEIDDSKVAYFHELQKIPDEMLEFIKTVAEDGQFRYGRNVSDSDSESGRTTAHVERDPLPVVFSFADENEAESGKDQELRTRTVEVKVDENEEKNAGVHDMKWGGEQITLPNSEHEYIRDRPNREHAVKQHVRDIPTDVDVVIPYGNGKFDGDDWTAADVVKPMFNFARSESARASANLAGLTMGSAICNYHARDAVCEDCGMRYESFEAQDADYECDDCDDGSLHIVVEPTDVANVIACRQTLLAVTHGLTEKKFALLDAIRERGGVAKEGSANAVQAPKQDIIAEIQENDEIATMTKSEVGQLLDELDEHLIINKKDNPDDRRENLYVYDGGAVFDAPNITEYYEKFADVEDPIREQPIEATVDEQLEDLNAKMDAESLTAAEAMGGDSEGGLDEFTESETDLSESEQRVAEALADTMDGRVIPSDVMEENSLKVAHMIGEAPVEYTDGDMIRPERAPNGADKADGLLNPDAWDDADDFGEAEQIVEDAVGSLRSQGLFELEESDGGFTVEVDV